MNLKELREKKKALLAEIDGADEKRFAEIQKEVNKINFKIEELEKEGRSDTDNPSEEELLAGREKRDKEAINKLINGQKTNEELTPTEQKRYAKSALGKEIRAMLTKTKCEYSPNEKRALGIALTTSSETFKTPTASEDGINNGGVFISQSLMYDLLSIDKMESAFLKDVLPTAITGAIVFPYVEEIKSEERGKRGKKEGQKANDVSIKWNKLTLAQGNYPLTIEVTMELLAMTDEKFAEYLLDELRNEMELALSDEALYGPGTDNSIEGVTKAAITEEYEVFTDGVKKALGTLSRRARKGACLYISYETSLDLAFEKDSNGRYMFPIYNQANGITSIVQVPVKVDDALEKGSFLFGNPKHYKLNFVKPVEIYGELKGRERVIEYTAHMMVAGKAAPNYFYYGKKKATPEVANN